MFSLLQGSVVVDTQEGADPPSLAAKVAALAGKTTPPSSAASLTAASAAPAGSDVQGRIKFLMSSHPVLLFMKGSPETPRCGFSRKVVAALKEIEVGVYGVLQGCSA